MKYKGPEIFQSKAETILHLLTSEPHVDLWKLRELALSDGGLVNDEIRCLAWPKLVGLHDRLFSSSKDDEKKDHKTAFVANASPRASTKGPSSNTPTTTTTTTTTNNNNNNNSPSSTSDDHSQASTLSTRDRILAVCDDFEQIERDVARCTWHLLNGNQRQVAMQMEHKRHNSKLRRLIQRKQRRLANLINLTLQQSYPLIQPKLKYYQGYHDVACVLLATLGGYTPAAGTASAKSVEQMAATMGLDLPASVLLQLTQSHLADFCQASFASLQTALHMTVFPLLWALDPPLHDHLQQASLEPFFLLSWVLTWFSHEIRDTELVKRLFDAFLVGHALLPLYTAVAMMLHPHNRAEVLACECDFSLLHQTLQALPRNSSMVGWKYRPGDGYVSDHEEEESDDDDDDIIALENQLLHSDDLAFLKKRDQQQSRETPEAMSMESSLLGSSLVGAPKVPFQELLDHALLLMQRIPPGQLVPLATQYYGAAQVEQYLAAAERIQLLEPTPVEWAVLPTTPADWVLQQRACEGSSTRRGRKKEQQLRKKYPQAGEPVVDDQESIRQYLKQNTHTRPVIALGYGRPKKPRFTKKQQKQIVAVAAAVAVAVVAIVWGRGETSRVVVPHDETIIRSRDNSFPRPQSEVMRNDAWNWDDLPEMTDMTSDNLTSEAQVNIVVAVEEKKDNEQVDIPLQRASSVPFLPKVGQAAQQFQAHMGHQLDTIRDQTAPRIQSLVQHSREHVQHQIAQTVPHIQKVVKQSKRVAAHLQHELSDLPETRWKELAVALQQGFQQKAVVLRDNAARPSWNPIAKRVQRFRHSMWWFLQTILLESSRLVKQLGQYQLSDMPMQSIRMVRNMCPKKESQPLAKIPFFCE